MKTNLFLFIANTFLLCSINCILYAQIPIIQWQKCLGGTASDYAACVNQTSDGGYILTGSTISNDGDVSGNHGGSDLWVVKLSSFGIIEWQKCIGGSNSESGNSIQQTSDGGYIVAGYTYSNDGDVIGNHGGYDVWIVKLTNNGIIQWQKCLGGSNSELGNSIQQTSDGGFIVAGQSSSNNENVTGNHGGSDVWIVKLNNNGNIQWQKCLGGSNSENAECIQQTSDGGYIVAGQSSSSNGDVSGNHGGSSDIWLVKISSFGIIEWQKCLGGTSLDYAASVIQTSDGEYIVAGNTSSNNGDVSGNHGSGDIWIVKLTNSGLLKWQKYLSGSNSDYVEYIQQTSEGGFIVAGNSYSYNGDVSGNHGSGDAWIVKLSPDNTFINENIELMQTQIFPNPAKSFINLNFDLDLIDEKYQICNSLGQIILTGIIFSESMKIDLSKYSSGLYFIKIGNKNNQTIKFIIE